MSIVGRAGDLDLFLYRYFQTYMFLTYITLLKLAVNCTLFNVNYSSLCPEKQDSKLLDTTTNRCTYFHFFVF
jgi:hypothetical protein